jgi:N-acetylmuramoyl-L-alanine amidase
MKISEIHQLVLEEDHNFDFRFDSSPNVNLKPQLPQRTLIIHAPGRQSISLAVSEYKQKPIKVGDLGKSVHLILGKDGRELVQMVPFNTGAVHAFGYNGRSIAIELEYPGELPAKGLASLKPNAYILASALGNSRYGHWPLFPKTQLDSLVEIVAVLANRYPGEITDVVAKDEILDSAHPGPAFPIIQFREKLHRENILDMSNRSIILQEISRLVSLLGQPGQDNTLLSEVVIPPGTPVTVINEKSSWYLIGVIDEPDGNPWLMGWVEKSAVQVRTNFTAVVTQDHYLTTSDGRRFPEITPHPNGFDQNKRNPEPKYIIMHFTTGTKMESTISHFKNPSAGVSTHLLIGRDGRVVQFLPFDRIAHHSGFSWWERQSNLNKYSIGIELDNAGLLSRGSAGWMARKIVIPNENVGQAVHWKQFTPNDPKQFPAWEKFPQAQIDVALNVVKALVKMYPSIKEILGHDDVNLLNRYDPGPMFPMKEWRLELFQREEPDIQKFQISQDTELYSNFDGRLPAPTQEHDPSLLPPNSKVIVMKPDVHWCLVKVNQSKESRLNGKVGWIRSNGLSLPVLPKEQGVKGGRKVNKKGKIVEKKKKQNVAFVDKRTTTSAQRFYKRGANQPTPILAGGKFPAGTNVRIQQYRGEWTLVVVLDTVKGRSGWEGWIRTEFLSPEVIP